MMKQATLRGLLPEKLARWALYGLLAVIALVFVLFFLVGYDRPYADNPNFREPLLTGVVVAFVILILFAAVVVALWSVVKTIRRHDDKAVYNGLPVRRIAMAVTGGTLFLLVLTWLLGSKQSMIVNGHTFSDTFWLKTADMFVYSILILLAAAIVTTMFASWRNRHNSSSELPQ